MSSILLPRRDKEGKHYISYSQITKWKKDKWEYIQDYFLKQDTDSPALKKYGQFGTWVGTSLENNDFSTFTEKERFLMEQVPRLDLFEREIRLNFKEFYVLGYIDTVNSSLSHLIDYKTGAMKKKVDYSSSEYTQLDIYAAAIKQETNKLPKKAEVVLIERVGNAFAGQELKLGREFEVIPRKLTMKRVKEVEAEIVKIANEISDYYKVFLKLTKL